MIRFLPLTLLALGACFDDEIREARDRDGDGFEAPELGGADCDDENSLVNPDAPEVCGDGVDNNCDGGVDDAGFGNVTWYPDVDGDGYGDNDAQQTCVAPDASVAGLSNGADCNDTDSAVNPGALDLCDDEVDNDCNGVVDDAPNSVTFYLDNDIDGFAGADEFRACEAPQVSFADLSAGVDCDDDNAQVSPIENEVCGDGLDNNCDGAVDDDGDGGILWYADNDDDGFPSAEVVSGCSPPSNSFSSLSVAVDCNDSDASIAPDAAEIYYDGVDQNCDGANDYDADGDGVNSDAHGGLDCLDSNAAVNPSGQEVCGDGLDNDCDGATDDSGLGAITWYIDSDNDGFPGATPFSGCSAPSGSFSSLSGGTDCNDLDGSVRPNASEVYYDGVDQNCDGSNDYDADLDGVTSDAHGGQDCDDGNPNVRPSAAEICNNGLDDDCSGDSPECFWEDGAQIDDVAGTIWTSSDAVVDQLVTFESGTDGVDDLAVFVRGPRLDWVNGPFDEEVTSLSAARSGRMTNSFSSSLTTVHSAIAVETNNGLDGGIMFGVAGLNRVMHLTRPLPSFGVLGVPWTVVAGVENTNVGWALAGGMGMGTNTGFGWATATSFVGFVRDPVNGVYVWNGIPTYDDENDSDRSLSRSGGVWAMQAVELNGDGRKDLLVTESRSGGAYWTTVRFSPQTTAGSSSLPALQLDDPSILSFDSNKHWLVQFDSSTSRLLTVASDGLRVSAVPVFGTSSAANAPLLATEGDGDVIAVLPVADYDGDGVHDAVALVRNGSAHELQLFLGVGTTGRTEPDIIISAPDTGTFKDAAVGDWNDDGHDDLAVSFPSGVWILYGSAQY